jgi:RNA polymerase sigma-70 factor (ECF subfamily)
VTRHDLGDEGLHAKLMCLHSQGLTPHLRHITVMRMTTSDEDLAQAAASGDGGAFASLLDRHYDRLFAFCFRLTGARADAEDLCQDICAALPAKLGTYQKRAKVTTWLYRVAVNAAHDRRRRRATYMKATDGWGDWEISRTAADHETAERIDWLTTAMCHLSDDLRDTLACVLDDMTHAQAAEVLGVSEGTISWRISEAKKALRALREKEDAV